MIKLPKQYNYAEAFLTFRCNFNCDYCMNKQGKFIRREELNSDEWAEGLNKINFGDVPITLGGGEPTIYKGFYNLLNKISHKKIDLLTNLSFDPKTFMKLTPTDLFRSNGNTAYKNIRGSYHPTQQNPKDLVAKAKILQDEGYSIGLFGLNHPKNYKPNMQMSELTRRNGIYFFIKEFLGEYNNHLFGHYKYPDGLNKTPQYVLCKGKDLLIAPDGEIHRCHRDLYASENPSEHILGNMKLENKFTECSNFGYCNPCDLKLRANRFLETGDCNMEIKK